MEHRWILLGMNNMWFSFWFNPLIIPDVAPQHREANRLMAKYSKRKKIGWLHKEWYNNWWGIHQEMTGGIFHKVHEGKFLKFIPESHTSNGMHFQEGHNVDILEWNPSHNYTGGAIYFCSQEQAPEFMDCFGPHVAEVTIPSHGMVYVHEDRFKAHEVVLSPIVHGRKHPDVVAMAWKKFPEDGCVAQYIPLTPENLSKIADANTYGLNHVGEIPLEMYQHIVDTKPDLAKLIITRNESENLQLIAVRKHPEWIHNCKNPSRLVQWAALYQNPKLCTKHRTPEMEVYVAQQDADAFVETKRTWRW